MPESLTPATAVSLADYQVEAVYLGWSVAKLRVWVRNPEGKTEAFEYAGPIALTLMRQLNKANLSVISLHRRILERLSDDGKLPAGTVQGTPD